MGVQVRFLVKAFVAARVGAGKRLLARVDPLVGLEVEVQRELFAALVALIRFFSLRRTQVEVCEKGEDGLVTYSVDEHVTLELRVV